MKPLLSLLAILAYACCSPIAIEQEPVSIIKTVSDCFHSGSPSLCFKEKALRITERMRSLKQLTIVDGFTLTNKEPTRESRSLDSLPIDPSTREALVEEHIIANVEDILQNTVLQCKLPGASDDDEESRGLEEGRGKKKKQQKKKKLLIHLLLKAKLFVLVPVFLGIIAITLFKALILKKIIFIFAAVTLLKKLLAKHQSSSHGWAPPAQEAGWSSSPHVESHGWENQGWDRTKPLDAQSLAYSGHLKV